MPRVRDAVRGVLPEAPQQGGRVSWLLAVLLPWLVPGAEVCEASWYARGLRRPDALIAASRLSRGAARKLKSVNKGVGHVLVITVTVGESVKISG